MGHDERLTVPRWWHPVGVAVAAVFGSYPAAYTDAVASRVITYLAAFGLIELLLWWAGRSRVRVADGILEAGRQRLPLSRVLHAQLVPDVRRELVPGSVAVTRAWVPTGVRVEATDGRWIISSRRPARLVAALLTSVTPKPPHDG